MFINCSLLCRPYTKLQEVTGQLDFDYANGPVALHGVVNLNWPCNSNSSLVSGHLKVSVVTEAVTINDAMVSVAYDCVNKTLRVDGSIASAAVGPASMKDVEVSMAGWCSRAWLPPTPGLHT